MNSFKSFLVFGLLSNLISLTLSFLLHAYPCLPFSCCFFSVQREEEEEEAVEVHVLLMLEFNLCDLGRELHEY